MQSVVRHGVFCVKNWLIHNVPLPIKKKKKKKKKKVYIPRLQMH